MHTSYKHNDHNNNKQRPDGFPSGIIRYNWNVTDNISMARAQGCPALIEKCKQIKQHEAARAGARPSEGADRRGALPEPTRKANRQTEAERDK